MSTTRAHVTLVVDRSGSMDEILVEAEAGIKLFIEQQASLADVKVTICLYQFDHIYEHVYGPVKIKNAPAYKLLPRASTALYDAVGLAIQDTAKVVADSKKTPDKVAIVIMTDGKENASHEYTFEAVSKLVAEKKALGWEVAFLAGTMEAVAFGTASGLTTRGYDPKVAGQTYAVYNDASQATMDWFVGETDGIDLNADGQKEDSQ